MFTLLLYILLITFAVEYSQRDKRGNQEFAFNLTTKDGVCANHVILAKDREEAYHLLGTTYKDCRIDSVFNNGKMKALKYYSEETLKEYEGIVDRLTNNWQFTFFPKAETALTVSKINGTFIYRFKNWEVE